MLSAVPETTITPVSCRLEDWENPNARIKFRKNYLQVFFQGFFGYPLFNMISFRVEANETLFHVRHCGCDHVTPYKTFFFLFASCHPWAREKYTRQIWERFCPVLFATQRYVLMNS